MNPNLEYTYRAKKKKDKTEKLKAQKERKIREPTWKKQSTPWQGEDSSQRNLGNKNWWGFHQLLKLKNICTEEKWNRGRKQHKWPVIEFESLEKTKKKKEVHDWMPTLLEFSLFYPSWTFVAVHSLRTVDQRLKQY